MTLHLLAGFTVTSHVSDHSWVGGRTKAGFWDRSDVGGPDLWEGPALADRWGRAQHLEGTATTTGAHSGPRCKALRAVGLSFLGPHCGSLERRLGALRLSLWVGGDSDRLSQWKPCSLLKSAEWGAAPGLVPLRACNGIGILLREEMPFGCTNSTDSHPKLCRGSNLLLFARQLPGKSAQVVLVSVGRRDVIRR